MESIWLLAARLHAPRSLAKDEKVAQPGLTTKLKGADQGNKVKSYSRSEPTCRITLSPSQLQMSGQR
jgi:hypothetical protein